MYDSVVCGMIRPVQRTEKVSAAIDVAGRCGFAAIRPAIEVGDSDFASGERFDYLRTSSMAQMSLSSRAIVK